MRTQLVDGVCKVHSMTSTVHSFISYFFPPQILNERALKYEPPVNKSLPPAPKGVDERKVVQALEELLEGPLISGFVSQEQVSMRVHVLLTCRRRAFAPNVEVFLVLFM